MNGYGIIREWAERSGGTWRPSSGAVYPALAMLEDEQLIGPEQAAGSETLTHRQRSRWSTCRWRSDSTHFTVCMSPPMPHG